MTSSNNLTNHHLQMEFENNYWTIMRLQHWTPHLLVLDANNLIDLIDLKFKLTFRYILAGMYIQSPAFRVTLPYLIWFKPGNLVKLTLSTLTNEKPPNSYFEDELWCRNSFFKSINRPISDQNLSTYIFIFNNNPIFSSVKDTMEIAERISVKFCLSTSCSHKDMSFL